MTITDRVFVIGAVIGMFLVLSFMFFLTVSPTDLGLGGAPPDSPPTLEKGDG